MQKHIIRKISRRKINLNANVIEEVVLTISLSNELCLKPISFNIVFTYWYPIRITPDDGIVILVELTCEIFCFLWA